MHVPKWLLSDRSDRSSALPRRRTDGRGAGGVSPRFAVLWRGRPRRSVLVRIPARPPRDARGPAPPGFVPVLGLALRVVMIAHYEASRFNANPALDCDYSFTTRVPYEGPIPPLDFVEATVSAPSLPMK